MLLHNTTVYAHSDIEIHYSLSVIIVLVLINSHALLNTPCLFLENDLHFA